VVAYGEGHGSLSGFRDAYKRVFGEAPERERGGERVVVTRLLTPLGPMIAGATDDGICLLEFADRRGLEAQLRRLSKQVGRAFVPGSNAMIERLDHELRAYFDGELKEFGVPLVIGGTEFQRRAWECLQRIPFAETRSYEEQGRAMGSPGAARAVGRANGDNRIAIVIPCHRVVGANGRLTGYGGGLWRKRELLEHEQRIAGALQPRLPLEM